MPQSYRDMELLRMHTGGQKKSSTSYKYVASVKHRRKFITFPVCLSLFNHEISKCNIKHRELRTREVKERSLREQAILPRVT